MGIGLGFGLTAYIIYRISLNAKEKPDGDDVIASGSVTGTPESSCKVSNTQ